MTLVRDRRFLAGEAIVLDESLASSRQLPEAGRRIVEGEPKRFRDPDGLWDYVTVDPYSYSIVDGQLVCPKSYASGEKFGANYGVSPGAKIYGVLQNDPTVLVDMSQLQKVNFRQLRQEYPGLTEEELYWKIGVFRRRGFTEPLSPSSPELSETQPTSTVQAGPADSASESSPVMNKSILQTESPVQRKTAVDFSLIEMPWLHAEAQAPRRKVAFDLGALGCVTVMCHHVVYREGGNLLSLIRDSRYPSVGYQPPRTDSGAIHVTVFPPENSGSEEIGFAAEPRLFLCRADPRLNLKLGCLEITNLIVVGPS